jgi:hypothetical protein
MMSPYRPYYGKAMKTFMRAFERANLPLDATNARTDASA